MVLDKKEIDKLIVDYFFDEEYGARWGALTNDERCRIFEYEEPAEDYDDWDNEYIASRIVGIRDLDLKSPALIEDLTNYWFREKVLKFRQNLKETI